MTLSPSSTVPVIETAAALEERVIKVVDIERIRYAHFRDGSSIRELARTLHHSRTTIRRALDDPGPWTYRRTRRRPAPVMDAVAPLIEAWLAADALVHRKQRHTARRLYQRLRDEHGFTGGEPTVRAWVRAHRRASLRGVTIPLAHDPGAEAQADFGEARVLLAGVETTVERRCERGAGRLGQLARVAARVEHVRSDVPAQGPLGAGELVAHGFLLPVGTESRRAHDRQPCATTRASLACLADGAPAGRRGAGPNAGHESRPFAWRGSGAPPLDCGAHNVGSCSHTICDHMPSQ